MTTPAAPSPAPSGAPPSTPSGSAEQQQLLQRIEAMQQQINELLAKKNRFLSFSFPTFKKWLGGESGSETNGTPAVRPPVERSTIAGQGTPPENAHTLNADWLGARRLPEGYDNVPWKPGQRWAATKSVAGKAFMPMTVGGAMAGLGSSMGSIPVIGKIPFLASAAGGLQSAITSVTGPLGLGTGLSATNTAMATLPTWAGPVAAGALAIPTALAGIGYAKGFVLGRRYGGFWNNVKAAAMMPIQAPIVAYRGIMSARERAWTFAKTATDSTLGAAYRFTKKQVTDYVIPAVQPNTPSVTGAVAGLSLALMNGTPVGPAMLAGYFGVKLARKVYEKLSGSGTPATGNA